MIFEFDARRDPCLISLLVLLAVHKSILTYNGGDIVAMVGANCVGFASDTRFGVQGQTIACDAERIFRLSDNIMVGLTGLATDVQTLKNLLTFKLNMYKLKEERDMKPETFSSMLSATLYEKRFGPYFVEPVVAGIKENGAPFISSMDLIGAECVGNDFAVAGTSTANLFGMCETLYRPNMNEDELFEVLSQVLLASVDRDALSGWGAVVHIMTKDGIKSRKLRCRQD